MNLKIEETWHKIEYWTFNPLRKNAFFLMLNVGVTSLLGFSFWLIVARMYSDIVVGYSSAIISALNLLAIISLVGFNYSLVRFLPRVDRPQDLINSTFTISGLVAIMAAIIFLIGIPLWSPGIYFIRENIIFIMTFLAMTPIFVLSILSNNIFIAFRRTEFTLIKDVSISFMRIIFALSMVFYFNTFGIIASFGLSLAIGLLVTMFIFIPRILKGYKPMLNLHISHLVQMWRYYSYTYFTSILYSAPAQILPLMVIFLVGIKNNAHFYVAWMIANLLNSISNSVSYSFFAESTNCLDIQYIKRNLMKSLRLVYLLSVPVLIVMLLISEWLLGWFGADYVTDGLVLLRLLCVSSLFVGFFQVYSSILRAHDRIKELVIVTGIPSLSLLALSYLLLPFMGIVSIGYIYIGIQFVLSISLGIRLYYWLKR